MRRGFHFISGVEGNTPGRIRTLGPLPPKVTNQERIRARIPHHKRGSGPSRALARTANTARNGAVRRGLVTCCPFDRSGRDGRCLSTHTATRDGTVLLSPADAARLAQVSRDTIYREIERGQLPARHVGRQLRIDLDDFRAYLDRERAA